MPEKNFLFALLIVLQITFITLSNNSLIINFVLFINASSLFNTSSYSNNIPNTNQAEAAKKYLTASNPANANIVD